MSHYWRPHCAKNFACYPRYNSVHHRHYSSVRHRLYRHLYRRLYLRVLRPVLLEKQIARKKRTT